MARKEKKIINLEQEKDIIEKYKQSIPLIKLQKEYDINYNRIKEIINRYNCEKISHTKRLNPHIKEDYFEKINSKEKAYWLGWIISDGSITNNQEKGKYQLEITLQPEDEDILHLLEKDLGITNKVYNSGEKYKRFSLGCKKIILDLEKLGITQNKSFTVKIPNIDKKYNSSLIRGIFDGDGGFSVYTRSTGQHCQELSFCGNQYIIEWIFNTLTEELPKLSKVSITNEASIKRIRWSSKRDIILLRDYLYKDTENHYLKRKYNLIKANTEVID